MKLLANGRVSLRGAAQDGRAAGNMGDKTDREHRLHPVTVGEWQRWGFRALISPNTRSDSPPFNSYELMSDHAEAQPATRRAFSAGTDVEHQPKNRISRSSKRASSTGP